MPNLSRPSLDIVVHVYVVKLNYPVSCGGLVWFGFVVCFLACCILGVGNVFSLDKCNSSENSQLCINWRNTCNMYDCWKTISLLILLTAMWVFRVLSNGISKDTGEERYILTNSHPTRYSKRTILRHSIPLTTPEFPKLSTS